MSDDEISRLVRDFRQGRRATSVEEFIAFLDADSEATVLANFPYIRRGPPLFQLIEGRIEGPELEENVTNEMFANIHVRNLAHALRLDLMTPPGAYYRWTNN